MSGKDMFGGDVQGRALLRQVNRCPDPVRVYRLCAEEGPNVGTALLETAETPESATTAGKSLVVARSALQIVCRQRYVEVRALVPQGRELLPRLARALAGVPELRCEDELLSCQFPALPAGSEEDRLRAASPVDVPRALMRLLAEGIEQPIAAPMLVGVFAYDLLDSYEPLPPAASDPWAWPDYELYLADRAIWLDHQRGVATVVAQLFGGDHTSSAYGEAVSAIARLTERLEQTEREQAASAAGRGTRRQPVQPAADLDDAAFVELVERLKRNIVAGDVFQIVPSRTFSAQCSEPLAAYRRLRRRNPSPYMFYMQASCGVLFGTSPETAVKVDGQPARVHIKPIAGTRPRGRYVEGTAAAAGVTPGTIDADLDSRYEAELRLNEKENAEHMMLVDLARNDVARVSQAGTRRVEELLHVERYSHVMHLVSHVSGLLRADLDALHAYVATMNMGTLVGAPKVRAAQLLREAELTRRGPYGGAVGYLTADGRMDTGIVIRAAVVRDGTAYVRAGAGVVYDSDPQAEADETRRKAQAVLDAVADEAVEPEASR